MSGTREIGGAERVQRSHLEKRILRYIFRALLNPQTPKVVTDIDREPLPRAPTNAIVLRLPNLFRTLCILVKPGVMLGQAYVNGHWSVQPERLYDFLYLIRSREASRLQKWFVISNRYHLLRDAFKQRLFPIRSTRAVVQHYNSDPNFVGLILGPSLCYTCALFEDEDDNLEDAQARKLELIANRISLRTGQTVLDMGSGWDYASFPLAEKCNCVVTGITISQTQIEFCNQLSLRSHARGSVHFVHADYATYKPPHKFDRVISLGMLEHVGKRQYSFLFNRVAAFLRDGGIALIHSMIEENETSPDAWIDRNIFPGGYIPTISEIIAGIETSECELIALFTHEKSNYFRTLDHWKQNLFGSREKCKEALKQRGLSETESMTVIRIWEYFLSSSQIAFSERYGRCRVGHFIVRRKTI